MTTDLAGLHPLEYEHPFDRQAIEVLQGTLGLDMLVRAFNRHAIERLIRVQFTGSGIRVTPEIFPSLHALFETACARLDLPDLPQLYLSGSSEINAFTVGTEAPIVVVTSEATEQLDDDEMLFLLAHELGHVKSQHVLYHQIGVFLPLVGGVLGQATLGLGRLLSTPLEMALTHWARMSELTCDRAGLLAVQDRDPALRLLMKLSGMPRSHRDRMNVEAFLDQARGFEDLDRNLFDRGAKMLALIGSRHPWTVLRAREIDRWIADGHYARVLARQTRELIGRRMRDGLAFCRTCGYRLEGGEQFCPNCGSHLSGG